MLQKSKKLKLTTALLFCCSAAYAQPRLVVEPDSLRALFDYCGPYGGEYAENLFLRLNNEGDQDLRIDSVTCDIEELILMRHPEIIEPHQRGNISFNTIQPELGLHQGTVTIFSNDPDNPRLEIPGTLNVIRSLRIFSPLCDIEENLYSGEIARFGLVLRDNVEEQIGFHSEANFEFVSTIPAEGVVGDTVIVVINAEDLNAGVYEIELTFHADRQDVLPGRLCILLNIEDESDIEVIWPEERGYPELIDLNVQLGEGQDTLMLQFTNAGQLDLEIFSISFGSRNFSVDQTEFVLGPSEITPVELFFRKDNPGVFRDTMTVRSNDPDESTLTIPIELNVALSVDSDNLKINQDQPLIYNSFPNPFNSSTTITFSAEFPPSIEGGQGGLSLKIYDLSGRLVADLTHSAFRNPQSALGKVIWNAANLPAGEYIVRLSSPRERIAQKIILLK